MRILVPLAVLALLALPTGSAILFDAPGTTPAEIGAWATPFDGEQPAINMVLTHTGDVVYWSGAEGGDSDVTFVTEPPVWGTTRILDLDTMTVSTPDAPSGGKGDPFCSGQTVLPDGRILVAGGSAWRTLPDDGLETPLVGTKDTRLFDPAIGQWVSGPDMTHGRWYPSVIGTPAGDALVASGISTLVQPQTMVEPLERFHDHGASAEWHEENGQLLPMYPRLHVVPGGPLKGDLFYQTVGALWGPFGEHPIEALWSLQQVRDADTGDWRYLGPSIAGARQHAAVVPLLLDPARGYAPELLTFGGTLQRSVVATPLTELADLSTDPPTNALLDPMAFARWHLNGVLLPDGSVLAIGGGLYDNVVVHGQPVPAVMAAERWDPATRTWETLAEMQVDRMYHSTAVLLPDGRVLAGGHVPLPIPFEDGRDNMPGQEQIVEKRLEIYSPPYLFWDARPVITSAPATATYAATITLDVDDTSAIESVVLMRPGSTTHSFDADQRGILLDFEVADGDTLTATLPPDSTVAHPGHYMLFVNKADSQGRGQIPSEASWIQLG